VLWTRSVESPISSARAAAQRLVRSWCPRTYESLISANVPRAAIVAEGASEILDPGTYQVEGHRPVRPRGVTLDDRQCALRELGAGAVAVVAAGEKALVFGIDQ